jgi:aryl-alcohol dehydrogenase-like predicted oxidoreductase
LLHRSAVVVPIPGTRSRARVDENVAAASAGLADDVVAALDERFPAGLASGPSFFAVPAGPAD